MALIKIGEAISIKEGSLGIQDTDIVLSELDTSILDSFRKTAYDLKKIAPKADDFLYFTAIMMHSAEASLVGENGEIKKDASGNLVTASWEKTNSGGIKWVCSDTSIMPYKNNNNDIFPESELKLAYKDWVGKPLCLDHKSDSVDFVRGLIVDTFYDEKLKRVIALCALDKVNYPDLARKVSTGYTTCVSMGTAVGEAVCTEEGCHRVARVESDFCDHMRRRSGYGEINTKLSPIELSIVVNGADPKAKIRHIVAAANSLAQYVSDKKGLINSEKEIISQAEIKEVKENLKLAQDALNRITKIAEEDDSFEDEKDEDGVIDSLLRNDNVSSAYGQAGRGTLNMAETEISQTEAPQGMPSNFPVLSSLFNDLESKVNLILEKVASLEAKDKKEKDSIMANKKAYFQGTEEPRKYPVEDYQTIRDTQDKQMVLNPENLGGMDGMVPGDEAEKKELQRLAAEAEKRRMRRAAALEASRRANKKVAYPQGTEEPTNYPVEDYQSIRDKEDKQMTGAAPFPNTGAVDELFPGDMDTKQMLARAKLNARFVKAANVDGSSNRSGSRWDVYAGKSLIMTASVNEITGGKVDALYDSVATREFGSKILSTIKSAGFNEAVKLFKGAQAVAETGALPAQPVDAGGPGEQVAPIEAPMDPEMEVGMGAEVIEDVDDVGATGEAADQVESLVSELDNTVADLKKALEALNEETPEISAEAPEMEDAEEQISLQAMRKTLNSALIKGIKQAASEIKDSKEELQLLSHIYNTSGSVNSENAKLVSNLHNSAVAEAKNVQANVSKLFSAFVKYARGTESLSKRAQMMPEMPKFEEPDAGPDFGENITEDSDVDVEWNTTQTAEEIINGDEAKSKDSACAEDEEETEEAESLFKEDFEVDESDEGLNIFETLEKSLKEDEGKGDDMDKCYSDNASSDTNEADTTITMSPDGSTEIKGAQIDPIQVGADSKFNLKTKAGRAALRAKLAQESMSFSEELSKAHPSGGTTTHLDVQPSHEGAKVEDLKEVHKKMMDVATSAPTNVREAAEKIQKLVVAGRINPNKDFPKLVQAGLDPAAAQYWKQYFGEAGSEGKEFANELTKDYVKKEAAAQVEAYKVKIARAYELAHDMAGKGLVGDTKEAVSEQVEDILTWDDAAFDSMKKVVARQKPLSKIAMPNVGHTESVLGVSQVAAVPFKAAENESLKDQLESMFSSKSKFYR